MENKSRAQIFPLRYMLQPWLDEPDPPFDETREARRAEMLSFGIDGASYVARFQQVLDSDNHLKQCCGWVLPLIDHIDRHLGTRLLINLMGTSHLDEAETNWDDFCDLTYAGPLKRFSYTHLFNFKTSQAPLSLCEARIETLDPESLAEILGENLSAVSFFHRPTESECFLDSYRFIRKQEYFNKFMQLVGVGGCFGWSGRLYGRPIQVCCWAVVLQRVDGERGCWRGARRVVCERE
jgi:hypothetical protein